MSVGMHLLRICHVAGDEEAEGCMTQQEVANVLGVSARMVQKIEASAIRKLRKYLALESRHVRLVRSSLREWR